MNAATCAHPGCKNSPAWNKSRTYRLCWSHKEQAKQQRRQTILANERAARAAGGAR